MSSCLEKWKLLTEDQYILKCVSGYELEFSNVPHQNCPPRKLCFSKIEHAAITEEISRLLDIGAITTCSHENGEFISNIFSRPKPDGRIRVILNLKPLNEFLVYEHFKMEHLNFVTELIYGDEWLCSVDLKDAYFAIPIHKSCWRYLKFVWNDQLFCYKVLVFGLSPAPRIFTRICKPILAYIRSKLNVRCSMYIDDMVLMSKSKSKLLENVEDVTTLLVELGFQINRTKSVLEPSKQLKHLGFIIDSSNSTLSLPSDKCINIENMCQRLVNSTDSFKIREIAKFLGSIGACSAATKWGKLYIRDLEKAKVHALKSAHGNYEALMKLSEHVKNNISWWLSSEKVVPFYFGKRNFKLELFSDASSEGWGGHNHKNQTGGRWSVVEKENSINWLELKAAFFTLTVFAKELHDCDVLINIDNTCAIAYIQNQGGVVYSLNLLANKLWLWCKNRNIWITARHIPGLKNTIADFKSRKFNDSLEWSLCQSIFKNIVKQWSNPDVDLFASRLNCKVKQFVSLEPDPDATATDAFSVDWGAFKLCYAFPPFNMIGRVLQKCVQDKAQLILVVPKWPTQHWFPMIHDLKTNIGVNPLVLPMSSETIRLTYKPNVSHPIWHRLNLLCYRISGST